MKLGKRTRKSNAPAKKKQKIEKIEAKMGLVVSKEKPDWCTLPDLAIIRVYVHLDQMSRLNLAVTCKRWEALYHSARLWRRVHLNFANHNHNIKVRDLRRVCRHGRYIRHLKVYGPRSQVQVTPRDVGEGPGEVSVRYLPDFLAHHLENSSLRSFFLCDVNVDKNFPHPEQMVTSLTTLLSTQSRLVIVQLSSFKVQFSDGISILSTLASMSGKTVVYLNILNLFESNVYALGEQFNTSLARFTRLKQFHVNYSCIDDEAVSTLAKTSSKTLQFLAIDVNDSAPHNHVISSTTWRDFKRLCPRVRVTFDLDDIGKYHDIKSILSPGIPLHTLKIWTGYDLEDETRLPAVFIYLVENFNQTIVKASFQVDNIDTPIDNEMLFFVQRCKYLMDLELYAVLGVDLVNAVCELKKIKQICLNKFHVTLFSATPEEAVDLMLVEEAHMDMLYGGYLDYQFATDADDAIIFSDSDETDGE